MYTWAGEQKLVLWNTLGKGVKMSYNSKLTLEEKRQILKRVAKRHHFDMIEPYDLELFFKAHNYTLIGELTHHLCGETVGVHISFVDAAYPKYAAVITPNKSISAALREESYIKDLNRFIKDKELTTIVNF